jgi:hypothetical protein
LASSFKQGTMTDSSIGRNLAQALQKRPLAARPANVGVTVGANEIRS